MTLAMALGNLMSTSGAILGIPCIISRNLQSVANCSGLVNKYAYISPVRSVFQGQVPVINTIFDKEVSHSDVICPLCDRLFPLIFHENITHVILAKLELLHRIFLSLN